MRDRSPLEAAVSEGADSLEEIKALLQAGADPNETDDHGYTIFMSAVTFLGRTVEILKLLVEAGADPYAVSDHGYNAFHAAIDASGGMSPGDPLESIFGYLKELGVDIEHRNTSGQTPLARAIESGFDGEVIVLCDLGADPNAVCPMHSFDFPNGEKEKLPLLFHAVVGVAVHKVDKTEALLRSGADPNVKDSNGVTLLDRVIRELCSEADASDYEATYMRVVSGLDQISPPSDDSDSIRQVADTCREFLDEVSKTIPISDQSQFGGEWREEKLGCIALLKAYGAVH